MSSEEVPPQTTAEETPAPTEEETAAPVEEEAKPMSMEEALRQCLKKASVSGHVARGLHEAVRALDSRQAHLCCLAQDCDEPQYVALVEALCKEHEISLIKVQSKLSLGEWAGLCKVDHEGNPRKIVACSCVVISDWGEAGPAFDVIQEHLSN